uniref:Uncharacterized protein n=1 Tax=Spumella elongata TaxID=89044 RepID=A0A7S3GQ46_9STRA|mmetsp:Transcript_13705/g.24056  ORF Transcript_13705/g.24056 Transcript_13705/m.24056 type:complete len:455 (+) Transcript_13705:70-1434(+)|eukprot:CAMPEP_0184981542 /NCGR_PEP_ID=MMETSP1098-20130426/11209_1 /TAXON_ID=89044 /ORGANISM="Spumella elongata, Strain CCAP 955/1" /LENGTH=454 /DNA_ID=CAMNT_0027505105 /DNA_START=75 /DNA_END=1439 /DNA_ORIENTATION=-
MSTFVNETSNVDNLPTPPRIVSNTHRSPRRDSPHSVDMETNSHNGSQNGHKTPTKDIKHAGHGRSSSPRPRSASPSEFLLKTTTARTSDAHVLEERRKSLIAPPTPEPTSATKPKKILNAPSERLLKTTEARLSDRQAWHATKGVIKHEQDIWWEQRKPLGDAHKVNQKAESRLFEPTTCAIYSQRKKFPPRTTPDKHAVPGSAEKSPVNPRAGSPLKVAKIDVESPLLRTTFNSIVKNVKTAPVQPPLGQPEIFTQNTGPQNVPSRLFSPTNSTRNAKWKSREELAMEEAELAARQAAVTKKVKAPSEHLVTYNTAMKRAARTKAVSSEPDRREMGWNSKFKKDTIPPVDAVPLLPGQRPGGSPFRRRSDGGSGREQYQSSMNSSIDSHEDDQHQHLEGEPRDSDPGAYPGDEEEGQHQVEHMDVEHSNGHEGNGHSDTVGEPAAEAETFESF